MGKAIVIISFLVLPALVGKSQLVINEVCPRNGQVVTSPTGDQPDWVEVYNGGTQPVELDMYFLADRSNEPFQWQLPAQQLAPGAHLVLMAADGADDPGRFNFSLAGSGETVYLNDADGNLVSFLEFPELQTDHSYGLTTSGAPGIFITPTPGMANTTPSAPAYAQRPQFTLPPGHQPASGNVAILSPEQATIHYTTDGSDPTVDSPVFQTAFPVESTRVVKAFAASPGTWPSAISTATYLVDVADDLPVMSLAVHPDSMFHPDLGIYSLGPGASPDFPYYGANFWSDNDITADMQYFERNGELKVDQRVDLRIHGGTRSRTMPQRPLRLTARKSYGNGTIDHAFFPEKPGLYRHKRLVLRNSGADFCLAQLRDGVFHQMVLHQGLNVDVLGYRECVVFINGEYWGLMDIRERIDADYLEHNYGADPSELLLMEEENGPIEGDSAHFGELQRFIRSNDMNDPANFAYVESQLDIASFKDYFAVQIHAGNADWPANNLKYWKPSPTRGKWRYILYDLDATMNIYGWIPMSYDEFWEILVHRAGYIHSEVFRSLLGNAEFKRTFINRLADLLNTTFSQPWFQSGVDRIVEEIGPVVPRHFTRWGAPVSQWEEHALGRVPTFAEQRPGHVRGHIMGTFPPVQAVELHVDAQPPGTGAVVINTITPELPFTGTYFHFNPIDLRAEPHEGYRFDHWSCSSCSGLGMEPTVRHDFALPGNITAHFLPLNDRIHLYPNPTADVVRVDWGGWPVGTVRLMVADALGHVVVDRQVDISREAPAYDLHVAGLADGVYTLQVRSGSAVRHGSITLVSP